MPFATFLIVAALSGQTPAPTESATAATQQVAENTTPVTPAQQRARDRAQAQLICSRRAPTGRRLEQTSCVSREMAAAQARAGKEDHEESIQNGAWEIRRGN